MSSRYEMEMMEFSLAVARDNLTHAESECEKLRRENERLRARLAGVLEATRGVTRVTLDRNGNWSPSCWRPRGRVWSGRRGGKGEGT